MANRFLDSFDSGSNYKFQDKTIPPNFPRSMFDLSHLLTTTIDKMGRLIPISVIPTLPGDSFDLSVRSLLRVLPQVVPLYSRQRLYVHAFYSRAGDLWENFNTFMTKGYSGKSIRRIPTLNASMFPEPEIGLVQSIAPGSLHDMMGLPIGMSYPNMYAAGISALPNMMYLRIWRDYFINRNYYINNRKLLPDNDADFRLMDDGTIRSFQNPDGDGVFFDDDLYRDYPDDYFLSALPFPQRGDTPTIDVDFQGQLLLRGDNEIRFYNSADGVGSSIQTVQDAALAPGSSAVTQAGGAPLTSGNLFVLPLAGQTSTPPYVDLSQIAGFGITLADIRALAASQQEMERMARTDGSYAEFGLTFYGRSSKTAMDYRPVYIGGTYQPIAFTEVLQTTPTDSSPLGTYGGHGISSTNDGYIGHIDCDDYGYIMLLASVMPDVYYSQGVDRHWTNSLQADMFLPTRSKLGMRAILNKELYFSGDPAIDNDLYAYQDPFDEFRYMSSRIAGKIADPTAHSFFPYTQSRNFNSVPTYSQSFATTKGNVRNDYLAAPTEVPYTAQFSFDIRAVRPLPYKAIPAEIVHGGM